MPADFGIPHLFAYLIAIMILRPRGLLGEETREAG